jgi:hypothetical protein
VKLRYSANPSLLTSLGLPYVVVGGVALVLVAGVAFWLYRNREWFNPASQSNLANQATSSAVQALTGGAAAGGEDSLGGLWARWFADRDDEIEAMKRGAPAPSEPDSTSPFQFGA